jgi:hypothetical protein
MREGKESKDISIGIIPLIVLLLAAGWVGFAVVSIIRNGNYIWLSVIAAAIVLGVGIAYLRHCLKSQSP